MKIKSPASWKTVTPRNSASSEIEEKDLGTRVIITTLNKGQQHTLLYQQKYNLIE